MSAPKNKFQRARAVIDSLVQGVHPISGKDLPRDSIVNEIEVTRALNTAVLAIEQVSARLARRAQLPESVGKTWTSEEEQRLRDDFTRGKTVPELATKHRRTVRAIEARLERIGLLSVDRSTSVPPYLRGSGSREKK